MFRKLKDSEFCSEEHREAFQQDQQRQALDRLIETEKLLTAALATRKPVESDDVAKRGLGPGRDTRQLGGGVSASTPGQAGVIPNLPGFAKPADVALSSIGMLPWLASVAMPVGPPIEDRSLSVTAQNQHVSERDTGDQASANRVEEASADPPQCGPLIDQIRFAPAPDAVPTTALEPVFGLRPFVPAGPGINKRVPETRRHASNGISHSDVPGVMASQLRRDTPGSGPLIEPKPEFRPIVRVPQGPEIEARVRVPQREMPDPVEAGMLPLARPSRALDSASRKVPREAVPEACPATILVPWIPALQRPVLEPSGLVPSLGIAAVQAKSSPASAPWTAADLLPVCAVQIRLAGREVAGRPLLARLLAEVQLQPFGGPGVPVESVPVRAQPALAEIRTAIPPAFPKTAISHIATPGLRDPLVFSFIPADMERGCRTRSAIFDPPPAIAIPGIARERLTDPAWADLQRTESDWPVPSSAPLRSHAPDPVEYPTVPTQSGLVVDPRRRDFGPTGSLLDVDWTVSPRAPADGPANGGSDPLPAQSAVERPRLAPATALLDPRAAASALQMRPPSLLKRMSWAGSGLYHRLSRRTLLGASVVAVLIVLTASAASLSKSAASGWWKDSLSGFRVRAGERASIRLSEDFRSGLDQWKDADGATAAWTFDPSGFVQPGKFAIYRPSEGLTDYTVEFLGQIDSRAMSWAMRARDARNYYAVKLIITKPGPLPTLVLRRYAVLNGRETAHHDTVLPMTVRGDAIFRVRADVVGPDFSIRIQDHLVDFWTDVRLYSGGVGFFSSKGERSKIKWVQVAHNDDLLGQICGYLAPRGPGSNDRVVRESGKDGETQ